jgi:hypothetical protein
LANALPKTNSLLRAIPNSIRKDCMRSGPSIARLNIRKSTKSCKICSSVRVRLAGFDIIAIPEQAKEYWGIKKIITQALRISALQNRLDCYERNDLSSHQIHRIKKERAPWLIRSRSFNIPFTKTSLKQLDFTLIPELF